MKSLLHVPVIATAAALLLSGCGGADPAGGENTAEQAVEGETASSAEGLSFEAVEELTPDVGYIGHEKEGRCQIVEWSENSTGITPEELRDKSTFFRQMDCYKDDSGFPEMVQVGIYAEFTDEESVATYVDSANTFQRQFIVDGTTVFIVVPGFDADFAENVRQLCDCELNER